jgi:hypothetical protein
MQPHPPHFKLVLSFALPLVIAALLGSLLSPPPAFAEQLVVNPVAEKK